MRTQTRAGFTLVELMVAMALTLFIMVILSQAFVLSLETFAGMKGFGDMQINLRVATNILRDDLGQDHFEGKRRLSDMGPGGAFSVFTGQPPLYPPQLPQAGFFAVLQRSTAAVAGPAYFIEGTDTNGLTSYRATDHVLYMTVKRRGNRQQNFFTTALPGTAAQLTLFFGQNTAYDVLSGDLSNETMTLPYTGALPAYYSSQWAEVVYYLVRVGSTEEPNNPTSTLGTPTFGLYRSQFVMVPDGTNVSGKLAGALDLTTFVGMSCNSNPASLLLDFYSPADAAAATNPIVATTPNVKRVIPDLQKFNPAAAPPTRILNGQTEALVLPNVISFQIQIMPTGTNAFGPTIALTKVPPVAGAVQPKQHLFDTALFNYAAYTNTGGQNAIQITLRVWDNKTRQTRQVTIVQDL